MNHFRLAAFKIERRSVAAAVFLDGQLDYTQVRQLSSDYARAESSAVGFAQWIVATFETESVAIERLASDRNIRRASLTVAVVHSLRAEGVAVREIPKSELLGAFGVPALKTRRELRTIIRTFWPVLPAERGNGSALDAAALGLYAQTDRQFEY